MAKSKMLRAPQANEDRRIDNFVGFMQPYMLAATPGPKSGYALGPGIYSLGTRANVPFVRVVCGGFDKTISWGELVEIPSGDRGVLVNASYHAGNVWLNKGEEAGAMPSRISFATQIIPVNPALPLGVVRTRDFVDCRRARQVWLIGRFNTILENASYSVIGEYVVGRNGDLQDVITTQAFDINRYQNTFLGSPTNQRFIPIGYNADNIAGDTTQLLPHALFERAYFTIPDLSLWQENAEPGDGVDRECIYTIEYVR